MPKLILENQSCTAPLNTRLTPFSSHCSPHVLQTESRAGGELHLSSGEHRSDWQVPDYFNVSEVVKQLVRCSFPYHFSLQCFKGAKRLVAVGTQYLEV
jgi:hypothetical protein